MQQNYSRVIEQVAREKGLDRRVVVRAVENAMVAAVRKIKGAELPLEGQFNDELGSVEVFRVWTVVDEVVDPESDLPVAEARQRLDPEAQPGDELLEKFLDDKDLGRIAAQAAKQILWDEIRKAEREIVYNEFKDKKGEIVSGIVTRFERKNMIVQLRPNVDAVLPEKEQIPRERYRPNDRIRAFVIDVDIANKGPQIVLSRTHPGILKKLFEQEVPEIYEGIVEIRAVAREPGGRAKIAVFSNDRDVDPVGACVGMKGTRVQSVVQELRGEKIDIVNWTADPAEFVCRALAPAKVAQILMDEEARTMEVIVPDDQLSLAIGRKGQNVRLASRMTEWKLDVRSEGEAEEEARRSRAALISIDGISDVVAEFLLQEGFKSAQDVIDSGAEMLREIDGVDPDRIDEILASAEVVAEETRKAEAEAARVAAAEVEKVRALVHELEGVEDQAAESLIRAGYNTREKLARAETTRLVEILAAEEEVVDALRTQALRQVGTQALSRELAAAASATVPEPAAVEPEAPEPEAPAEAASESEDVPEAESESKIGEGAQKA